MTEAKHTPTLEMHPLPWSLDAEEACILDATGDAVQHFEEADEREFEYHALIVSAVNAYPLLNEAAEVLRELLRASAMVREWHAKSSVEFPGPFNALRIASDLAEVSLSKLEGTMTEPTEDESENGSVKQI